MHFLESRDIGGGGGGEREKMSFHWLKIMLPIQQISIRTLRFNLKNKIQLRNKIQFKSSNKTKDNPTLAM